MRSTDREEYRALALRCLDLAERTAHPLIAHHMQLLAAEYYRLAVKPEDAAVTTIDREPDHA